MSSSLNFGDLPSWIMVLLIGLGIVWATSNGALGSEYESWGRIMMIAAGGLGAFHHFTDVGQKF